MIRGSLLIRVGSCLTLVCTPIASINKKCLEVEMIWMVGVILVEIMLVTMVEGY